MKKSNLIKDVSPGAYLTKVKCAGCGRLVMLAHAYIDPEGTLNERYYCLFCKHIKEVIKESKI